MTALPDTLPPLEDDRFIPKLWSVKRIAERWCCSPSKVRKLLKPQRDEDGTLRPSKLPSVKFEGMVRVRLQDLEHFEACQTTPSTGSAATGGSGSPSTATARQSAVSRLRQIAARQANQRRSAKSAT